MEGRKWSGYSRLTATDDGDHTSWPQLNLSSSHTPLLLPLCAGYVNYASHFYKLVLSAPPELVDDPTSDLKQEAAYNLSLIYKASQNKALARHILWTYIHV